MQLVQATGGMASVQACSASFAFICQGKRLISNGIFAYASIFLSGRIPFPFLSIEKLPSMQS
jgi:hypothetical protein